MIMANGSGHPNWIIKYTVRTVSGREIPRKDGILYNEPANNMPKVVQRLAENTAEVGDFAFVEAVAREQGGQGRTFRYVHHGETGFASGQ